MPSEGIFLCPDDYENFGNLLNSLKEHCVNFHISPCLCSPVCDGVFEIILGDTMRFARSDHW
jgi:hypothetical protein